jgi:hypothetical protein
MKTKNRLIKNSGKVSAAGVIAWGIAIIVLIGFISYVSQSSSSRTNQNPAVSNTTNQPAPLSPADAQANVALKSKCADDGKAFIQSFEQSMSGGSGAKPLWFDPQFHFNSRLNTCLAYIQFNTVISDSLQYDASGLTSGNWNETVENNNIVFDVYSNQAILQSDIDRAYTYVNSQKSESDTLSEYPYSQTIPNSNGNDFLSQLTPLMSQ